MTLESIQSIKELAFNRISRKECSSKEVYFYLKRKGAIPDLISQVIQELIRLRYLDDSRYARLLIRDQILKGKGPTWIKQKLKLKGIDLSIEEIRAVSSEATVKSEEERAQCILEKKFPSGFKDLKEKSRALGLLIRRGFSYSIAKQILDNSSLRSKDE